MSIRSLPAWGRVLLPVWIGQLVSLVGSGLSEFALSLWVFQHTASVTQFAFVLLFRIVPVILLSPLAGVLADRWERKKVMLLSDSGAALSTLVVAVLFLSKNLEPWHVCLAAACSAAFGAFQTPAYLAAISSLVPPKELGRVNGMLQIGQAITEVLVPSLAGLLMVSIGVSGVVLIDFASFLVAVATLLGARFPRPEAAARAAFSWQSLREDTAEGLAYLRGRAALRGLLAYDAAFKFFAGMLSVLLIPLFLSVTSVAGMGLVLTVAGCGLLLGSLALSAWGGPASRLHGMLGAGMLFGCALCGAGLGPGVGWVAACAFLAHFSLPFANGFNQALWQGAVEQAFQGRVLALRQMALRAVQPAAVLAAGLLADRLFEPLLRPGGGWALSLGVITGLGQGRGSALLVALSGLAVLGLSLAFWAFRPLAGLEAEHSPGTRPHGGD